MTFHILADLFSRDNVAVVLQAVHFAVTNQFYSRLLNHYGLGDLCIHLPNGLGEFKWLEAKGDILEAYCAAVEMDPSREGGGYAEVCNWLHEIIAIRLNNTLAARACLRNSQSHDDSGSKEAIVEGALPEESRNTFIELEVGRGGPGTLTEAPNGHQRRSRTGVDSGVWWDIEEKHLNPSPGLLASKMQRHRREPASNMHGQLQSFRQSMFDKMRATLAQIRSREGRVGTNELRAFWTALKFYLDGIFWRLTPSYLGMILTKSANSFAEAPKSDLMGNDLRQSVC
jgi:hypothetical protein